MPHQRRLRQVSLAVLLACLWQSGAAAESASLSADSLVSLPFEELLETDVAGAAGFVREVTDAPSAVSVVTAEEIKRFGYRTLAEVLENLPGLVLDFDGGYYYLGSRGYSIPGQYFGRFLLLIDGYPAPDNYYNQTYLGDEGLLDVSMIDRVEYAPGPGAGLYGNNAFLGVIHVFTRKGRDVGGGELASSWGSRNNRKTRLNLGGRTDGGADWVLSVADRNANIQAQGTSTAQWLPSHDQKLFLKAARDGWWLEAAQANRDRVDNLTDKSAETYTFWQLGRNVDWRNWKATFRLNQGAYRYDANGIWNGEPYANTREGSWWGGQVQLATAIWSGHRLAWGAEYRADQRLQAKDDVFDPVNGALLSASVTQAARARNLGVYLQDEVQLSPTLDLSLALRHDRRTDGQKRESRTNPRMALVYRPGADTSLKLSHGTASRWSSWFELRSELGVGVEKVRTTELVLDQHWPSLGLRMLGSAYHYRLSDLLKDTWPDTQYVEFQGGELALEWHWNDATVKASYAHQSARTDKGFRLPNSIREVGKVQVSVPLASNRWRASLAVRGVAERNDWYEQKQPGYAVTDLTLLGRNIGPGLDVTFGVRNLFNRSYSSVVSPDSEGLDVYPRDGRTYWLQLEYRFK